MDLWARRPAKSRLWRLVFGLAVAAAGTGFWASARAQGGDAQDPGQTSQLPAGAAPTLDAQSEQKDEGLRDIKPLRPAKAARWPYVLAAAAALAGVALGLWRWLRRRAGLRAAALAQRRQRPAHEIALAALQALHRVNFADEAAIRQYYFDISEVLRAYVTARFDLSASQLTTEEIFSRLPRLAELAPPENLRLRTFLAQTDQVKYALHQPTPEEISATFAQATAFIEATIRPAPAADADAPVAKEAH